MVVLCPAVSCDFVKGFHTSGTDFDVPAKKHSISRVSLQATRLLSSLNYSVTETQRSATKLQETNESTMCSI